MSAADSQFENPVPDAAKERAAVVDELAQRSGLGAVELDTLLADCGATQQSMYFCAWRDQIDADRVLARTLTDKQHKMPQCASIFKSNVEAWIRSRDQRCAQSAHKAWGDGSMRRTAELVCTTQATLKKAKRLACTKQCERSG